MALLLLRPTGGVAEDTRECEDDPALFVGRGKRFPCLRTNGLGAFAAAAAAAVAWVPPREDDGSDEEAAAMFFLLASMFGFG